jgi:hypothetical protein
MNRISTILALAAATGVVALAQGGQPSTQPKPKAPAATIPAKPQPSAPAKPADKPAATQPGGEAPSPDQIEQMKKAIEEASKPGPEHAALARRVGDWATTTSVNMGAGMPPLTSTGTAKISMILGGRFQVEEAEGNLMGQPYTSHRMLGFNKGTGKYEGTWTYTMSTAIMTITGATTDGGKTQALEADVTDETRMSQHFWITVNEADNDHFTVKMSTQSPDGKDGQPGPVMETAYTRKK